VSRGQHAFRERDLTRAVRAVLKAGVCVRAATVDAEGKISVIIGQDEAEMPASELDRWLGNRGRRHAGTA
jgi:hypothetical protein